MSVCEYVCTVGYVCLRRCSLIVLHYRCVVCFLAHHDPRVQRAAEDVKLNAFWKAQQTAKKAAEAAQKTAANGGAASPQAPQPTLTLIQKTEAKIEVTKAKLAELEAKLAWLQANPTVPSPAPAPAAATPEAATPAAAPVA